MKRICFWNKHGYFLGQVLTFSPPTECWRIYKQNPLQKPKLFSPSFLTSVNQELRDSHLMSSSIKLFEDEASTSPLFFFGLSGSVPVYSTLRTEYGLFSVNPLRLSSHPSFQCPSLPATLYMSSCPPPLALIPIRFSFDFIARMALMGLFSSITPF